MAVIGGIESVQLDRVTSRNGTRSLIGYSNVVKGIWPGQQTFWGVVPGQQGFFLCAAGYVGVGCRSTHLRKKPEATSTKT